MDGYLYENIKSLAQNIVKDMTYLGIIFSSTYEVGAGKSTLAQQIGECYTELVNEYHGMDLKFTEDNIIFNPRDLMETAFKLPQYSILISDEWEDLHYWSEMGKSLRHFFRKCRQLNLFIIIIIPNFFQLPPPYALSRSLFAIDVRFKENFDRGLFAFYNYTRKNDLYIKGKKGYNYKVTSPNFIGGFLNGYAIDAKAYSLKKRQDLEKYETEEGKPLTEKDINIKIFNKTYIELKKSKNISIKDLAKVFGISERTAARWVAEYKKKNSKE